MSFFVYPDVGLFRDGAVATPGIGFLADQNTGFWRPGTGLIGVTGDGLEIVRFSAPGGATPQAIFANGVVGTPAISFTGSASSGFYYSVGIWMALGGANRWFWSGGYQYSEIAGSGGLRHDVVDQTLAVESRITTSATVGVSLGNWVSFTGASAITQIGVSVAPTVNQSSTTGFTALRVNVTQTAVGSGHQTSLDIAIAAVSKLSVFAKGAIAFTPGTPASMAVTENDYNAAGFLDVTTVRLTGNAANTVITGFVAPLAVPVGGVAAGQLKILINIAAPTITINHQDAGSTAANRVITSTGLAVVLTLDDSIILWYDSTTARWRQLTLLA